MSKGLFYVGKVIEYGEYIYFLTVTPQSSLWRYQSISKRYELLYIFSVEEGYQYINMTILDGIIYLPPYFAQNIAIYNIQEKNMTFEKTPINSDIANSRFNYNLYNYIQYVHGYIFCIGKGYSLPMVICIRNDGCKAEKVNIPISDNLQFNVYRDCDSIIGNILYLPIDQKDHILKYDFFHQTYDIVKICSYDMKFNVIVSDGNNLWIAGNKNMILKWDTKDKLEGFSNFPKDFFLKGDTLSWDSLFSNGIRIKRNIIFSPVQANMFIKLNTEDGKIECLKFVSDNGLCYEMFMLKQEKIFAQVLDISSMKPCFELEICGEKTEIVAYLSWNNPNSNYDIDIQNKNNYNIEVCNGNLRAYLNDLNITDALCIDRKNANIGMNIYQKV